MRSRWRILFWLALGTLIGWAWLAQRWDFAMWNFINIDLVGMIVATAVAFHAMVTEAPQRARAWIAVVAALPAAYHMLPALQHLSSIISFIGVPGAIILAGTYGTIGYAIFVACAQPPPPPREDPIARAEVRQ